MDMWMCMRRAINAAERAKCAYDGGRSKVAEVSKVLQDHANLLKDKAALEQQLKASVEKPSEMRSALETTRVVLEEDERSRAAEIQIVVREVVAQYRSSEDFTAFLHKEVSTEMMDLIYRFKCFNPGQKLNLNFSANPPPLSDRITEEMIEDYAGEDAPPELGLEAKAEAEGHYSVLDAREPSDLAFCCTRHKAIFLNILMPRASF